jgi:PIN domain nuclease of toxin-antitoxin system
VILLDTHVWLWWASDPKRLSDAATEAIERAVEASALSISSISAWEVAMLVAKSRLELTLDVRDWIARTEALPFVRFIPVDNGIALRSVELPPPLHLDPADRIIIATAIAYGARLVTKDTKILEYEHVDTIW